MWSVKQLLLKAFEQRMPPLDEQGRTLAHRLRSELIVDAENEEVVSAADTWRGFSDELARHAVADDPREFLQWPVVRKSMFVSNARYIADEWRYLRGLPEWGARWRDALRESPIGRPRPYPRYPKSSGNLIHHAYSVARFELETGIKVSDLGLVYEFGGGYGSMARLFRQLGFQGVYLIQDLPAFSALQRFYLGSLGYIAEGKPTKCFSGFDQLRDQLAEVAGASPKLFLATWSVSESPIDIREQVLEHLQSFDYLLIALQHKFEDIDNLKYFQTWKDHFAERLNISVSEIGHLAGNSYLFASPKAT